MARGRLAMLAMIGAYSGAAAFAQAPPAGPIDTQLIRAHTYFLSHDLLEGRGTGRRGGDVAARYLAAQAQALGLRGAVPGGGFLQAVPLVEAVMDTVQTVLDVAAGTGPFSTASRYRFPESFIPNVGTGQTLTAFSGDAVYVGTAREVVARPAVLPNLDGRVAVMLGVFGPEAAAADTLRARGATGVLQVVADEEIYRLYVQSRGPSRMWLAREVTSSHMPVIPAVLIAPSLGRTLLAPARQHDELVAPTELGVVVRLRIQFAHRELEAHNVAAILPGASPALHDQYVVLTAHYDHLGISDPDAAGDSIYNGFSDNAAGCAMLLAVAAAMSREPRPPRSVLFLWLTGEERGLLGSDYFVSHPLVPPERMTGVINLDAGAPPAPVVSWNLAGGERTSLGQLAIEVAARAGWSARAVGATPNTDYFPFLRIGVPAISLVPAPAPYQGMTTEASQVLRRRWDRYHQAADHWWPDFPYAGLARYAEFAYRLGMELARGPRPRMLP